MTPYLNWKRRIRVSPSIRHPNIPIWNPPTSICRLSPPSNPVMWIQFQLPREYFHFIRFTFSPFTLIPFPPLQDRKTLRHFSRSNPSILLLPFPLPPSSTPLKPSISAPSQARTYTTPIWVAVQPTAIPSQTTSKARRWSTCLRPPVASVTTRLTRIRHPFLDPLPQRSVACR